MLRRKLEIAGFSHLSLTEGPRSNWSHWVCGVSEWNLVTKSYNPWAYNDSDNCVFLYSISEKIQGSLILHLKAHSYCQLQKSDIRQSYTTLDPTRGSGRVGPGQKTYRKGWVGSGPVRPEAKTLKCFGVFFVLHFSLYNIPAVYSVSPVQFSVYIRRRDGESLSAVASRWHDCLNCLLHQL